MGMSVTNEWANAMAHGNAPWAIAIAQVGIYTHLQASDQHAFPFDTMIPPSLLTTHWLRQRFVNDILIIHHARSTRWYTTRPGRQRRT